MLRVVGVFLGQEGAVDHAGAEVARGGDFVATDVGGGAEALKRGRVRPRERGRCGVDLVEAAVDAEAEVLVKARVVMR